jgi:hypothetical protein
MELIIPPQFWFSVSGSEFRVKSFQPETLNHEPETLFHAMRRLRA